MLMFLLACATADEPAPEAAVEVATADAPADRAPGGDHAGHKMRGDLAHEGHEGHHDATVHHSFEDVDKWVAVFDDPARDEWQKPAELVAAMSISPGMTVADIGAGTGYMNPHLAAAVGPGGRVLAVDVEKSLVDHMAKRAVEEGTPQVEARLIEPGQSGLAEAEADRVLLLDVYHHIDDRVGWFGRLAGAMKPGGQLVVVDFKPGDIPVGPPEHARIPDAKVTEELAAAGWALVASPDPLPYQYVRVYAPADGAQQ